MTKQEQIEEMGKVMPEKIKDPLDNSRYIIFGKSLRREIARIYYNAGYRKLPEDSVVLSREEYNLLINIKKFFETADGEISAGNLLVYLKEFKEQERKETAEKILKAFEYCNDTNFYAKWLELCKQFGVEIKE